jgi:hypothetical protein
MTICSFDAWVLARLLSNQPLNGELDALPEPWKAIGEHLAALKVEARPGAWKAMLAARPERDELVMALAAVDPMEPAPPEASAIRYATAADVRKNMSNVRFHWEPWIPVSRVVGLAALEGIGKTRFLMDLCRCVYLGLPWPDGQPMSIPQGSPMLWVCADGQHEELVEMLQPFGLPDSAIVFPGPPDDPTANTSLDVPETIEAINDVLATHKPKPWAVTIDSLTYATTRDLCEQRAIAILKAPLVEIVQRHQVNILLSLHVSQSGQALGRRIKGITRTLLHLECGDPEKHSERLRLWVEKSYRKKPRALGVTMGDGGNTYDAAPPAKIDPAKVGRPPDKTEKAMAFIRGKLAKSDQATKDLVNEWQAQGESKTRFFNARDRLVDIGEVVIDPDAKPQILHLVKPQAESGPKVDHS